MKKIYLILLIILFGTITFAQVPYIMNYQAVIRDIDGSLVINKEIKVIATIVEDKKYGTEVYKEGWEMNTNRNGLITMKVGLGKPMFGKLIDLDWGKHQYFFKTEITVGENTLSGTSQMLAVPYAFYAVKADSVENIDYTNISNLPNLSIYMERDSIKDNDPMNELQCMTFKNNTIYLSRSTTIIPLTQYIDKPYIDSIHNELIKIIDSLEERIDSLEVK